MTPRPPSEASSPEFRLSDQTTSRGGRRPSGRGITGEIYMIAVDPGQQGLGVGTALTQHAIDQLRAAGRELAVVETGGDPGHAAARATYEKAGFVSLPAKRYYLLL